MYRVSSAEFKMEMCMPAMEALWQEASHTFYKAGKRVSRVALKYYYKRTLRTLK